MNTLKEEAMMSAKANTQSKGSANITPIGTEPEALEHTLIEVYKAQWADIHHSRNQDWELSKIIFIGVIGLSGLKFLGDNHALLVLFTVALSFISLLAVAITYRHKILFKEKMGAIRKVEKHLGVDKLELFKSQGSLLPSFFNTQNLLITIYSITFMIFAIFSAIEIFGLRVH